MAAKEDALVLMAEIDTHCAAAIVSLGLNHVGDGFTQTQALIDLMIAALKDEQITRPFYDKYSKLVEEIQTSISTAQSDIENADTHLDAARVANDAAIILVNTLDNPS